MLRSMRCAADANTAQAHRLEDVRGSSQHGAGRPELYPGPSGLLHAAERLSDRERRRLTERFEREPLIAEAWEALSLKRGRRRL